MDLLFRRAQTGDPEHSMLPLPISLRAPHFKLWAKIELLPEELKIIQHCFCWCWRD